MASVLGALGSRANGALTAEHRRADEIDADWLAGPRTRQFLDVVRNLAEVVSIDIVTLDRATGTVLVAGCPSGDRASSSRALGDALAGSEGFMFAAGQRRWIEGWPEARHATLVTPVADLEGDGCSIAVQVENTPEARARAVKLTPDLVSLVRLHCEGGAHGQGLAEERDAAAQALDHGECGVVAIRSDHSIILANAAAHAMLAAEAGLRVRRGIVQPTSYADAVRFQQAIDRVTEPAEAPARPQAIVMLLSNKADTHPPILVIAPACGRSGGSGGAAAIMYLLQSSDGAPRGLDALCMAHGLSKVESRLAIHLASGLAMAEAAFEMRIKVGTARSYLKQIFGKVGVHRQADLIRLMSRYQRALRGNFDFQVA